MMISADIVVWAFLSFALGIVRESTAVFSNIFSRRLQWYWLGLLWRVGLSISWTTVSCLNTFERFLLRRVKCSIVSSAMDTKSQLVDLDEHLEHSMNALHPRLALRTEKQVTQSLWLSGQAWSSKKQLLAAPIWLSQLQHSWLISALHRFMMVVGSAGGLSFEWNVCVMSSTPV